MIVTQIFIARISLIDMQPDHKHWKNMSFAEFAANYTYKQERHNNVIENKDDLSGESEREFGDDDNNANDNSIVQTRMITLQNSLSSMRKRKGKAIIRWHNFNIQKEPEKYFRS